jgi:hypothetical protein
VNWIYVIELVSVALGLLFITARAERKRLWVVAALLDVPVAYLAYQWIERKGVWSEMWAALAAAALLGGAWWFGWGRKLPPVTTDNIKVWGQEAGPKVRPADVAAMQAEILQLKEDKERMEAELRRLKENSTTDDR